MKLGWLLLLCLCANAFAFEGEIRKLNINYNQPSGTANSAVLKFDQYNFVSYTEYTVELQAGSIFLETPDETVQFDNLPQSVTDVESIRLSNLDLLSNSSRVYLAFNNLTSVTTKEKIDLKKLKLDCQRHTIGGDFQEDLLHSCLNKKGKFELDRFKQDNDEKLSDLKFDMKNNSLKFQVKAAGIKVKGSGKTYYGNNMIRIKIDKAKVGPINVKGKLFDELEKMESHSVRVKSPWIEIDV